MHLNSAKAITVVAVVLLMACNVLMLMPVQAQEGAHGGTGTGVYGDPHLGDLPAGVTPEYTFTKTAYMSISPNPIGVGQAVLVNIWTTPGTNHEFYMQGYKVTIQKPDGTTDVVGPMNSYLGDCTAWFEYVVDQPGTWKAKFESPGTYLPVGIYVDRPGDINSPNYTLPHSVYYTAASTDWQEFTVQVDMVASWPSVPLPTDYWTRPISTENREWWTIAGNYPWTGAIYYPNGRILYGQAYTQYVGYVQAPNTAHVVWRRQSAISGLIGGTAYQYSLSSGGGTPSIIYAGRCYQTMTKVMNGVQTSVYECYNLRTGAVYWDLTGISPAPTNIYYEKPATGIVAGEAADLGYSVYLVAISGGRLIKYNPLTMAASANTSLASGITSGTIYGNELVLTVQTINATAGNYRLINWTMAGSSTNFTTRILGNVSWPDSTLGTVWDYDAGLSYVPITANTFFETTMGSPAVNWVIGHYTRAVSLTTGQVLWTDVSLDTVNENVQGSCRVADRGKVALVCEQRHVICWDGRTGKKLWTSELADYPWGNFWAYSTPASYDFNESKGAIIATGYSGIYAFDWDNGKILWHYQAPIPPFEDPYSQEPFFTSVRLADGKVYAYGGEHTPSQPITRGWHLHCVNATTGELLWKITGPMTPGAVADGYLTASDPYDGYMYVFGKGKSVTTVTAPNTAVPKGTAVLIGGTVMGMSPGDQGSVTNPTEPLDSPTKPGTAPCVSAASMETLMEYLYMQHPIDGLYHNETITGVPVTLTAIGSDGSVIDIGTTTTNGYYGTFDYEWTPPDKGKYTILASFAGDDSYGSSSAATGLSVGPAVETPSTPEIPTPIDNTMVIIASAIAIIIAVVISVAIVGALILRKR
jgi:outer membrane protein assembly factor BamB